MKWSKRTKSLTEKGEFSPHALPISGLFPKETLGASWHWQVGINPWQVSAISRMRSPWNRRAGLLTCFMQDVSFIHANRHHRVSKVHQKMCSLGEQKLELQASLPCPEGSWTSPQDERLLLNHAKTLGFLSSRGEEFNPGPEMRLDRSELLHNKDLLKYKGDRESFWHRYQKRVERVPLASVSDGVIYSPMN